MQGKLQPLRKTDSELRDEMIEDSRKVTRNVLTDIMSDLELPVQYNKDFTNSVIGDKDLNNRPEIIDPVGGPPLRAESKTAEIVNLRGRQKNLLLQ